MFLYTKEAACFSTLKKQHVSLHYRSSMWSIQSILAKQPSSKSPTIPFISPPPTPGPGRASTFSYAQPLAPDNASPCLSILSPPLTPQNEMPAPFVPSTYKPPHYDPLHTTLKRPRTALKELQSRFPKPATQTELAELCKPVVPQRTQSNNRWAESVFKKWVTARNSFATVEPFPPDLSHPCGGPGIGHRLTDQYIYTEFGSKSRVESMMQVRERGSPL